jgi:hypothetical protein
MTAVYRAPMRSRCDAVGASAAVRRALGLGLCGFGQLVRAPAEEDRLERRVARFADVENGSFVWTRDGDGMFWLGQISGPYFFDVDDDAKAVDLVHVRPCDWLSKPLPESDVPSAVVATFGRGGRNFQQTHHPSIDAETQQVWESGAHR